MEFVALRQAHYNITIKYRSQAVPTEIASGKKLFEKRTLPDGKKHSMLVSFHPPTKTAERAFLKAFLFTPMHWCKDLTYIDGIFYYVSMLTYLKITAIERANLLEPARLEDHNADKAQTNLVSGFVNLLLFTFIYGPSHRKKDLNKPLHNTNVDDNPISQYLIPLMLRIASRIFGKHFNARRIVHKDTPKLFYDRCTAQLSLGICSYTGLKKLHDEKKLLSDKSSLRQLPYPYARALTMINKNWFIKDFEADLPPAAWENVSATERINLNDRSPIQYEHPQYGRILLPALLEGNIELEMPSPHKKDPIAMKPKAKSKKKVFEGC
jgi:hypothetical protein